MNKLGLITPQTMSNFRIILPLGEEIIPKDSDYDTSQLLVIRQDSLSPNIHFMETGSVKLPKACPER